jgi:membrane protein DedA with SNARE-associated domain
VISELLYDITMWLGGLGYWGVFIACFGVFPAEVVISALAALWPDKLVQISLVAALGESFGAIPPYLIGLYFHKKDILGFIERRGKLMNVSKTSYQNGYNSITKNGALYLFFARFVPWVRVAASLIAGYVKYSYIIFTITVFIPTFIYAYAFAYTGSKVGFNWHQIKKIMDTFNNGMLILIGLSIVIYVYTNRKKFFKK